MVQARDLMNQRHAVEDANLGFSTAAILSRKLLEASIRIFQRISEEEDIKAKVSRVLIFRGAGMLLLLYVLQV